MTPQSCSIMSVDRRLHGWPGRPPRVGIVPPRKDHRQGRSLRSRPSSSLQADPLTVIFDGKTRHLTGGRGEGNLSQVARFIHLNGPPGIGKSTVATVFADRHPGVLNLDIDQVTALIGGWRDRFSDSFEAGTLLAAAMARVHLANGHDVIMPQMMTNVNAWEFADFESAAAAAKADYCQILLTARVESAVDRCMERAKAGDPRQDVISKIIDENGGRDFLRKLHSQVTQFTAGRLPRSVIDCERLTVEQTYHAIEAALRPASTRS